jgi:hypothetical protein
MINRQTFLRTSLAAAIVGVAVLSGCAPMRPSMTTTIYDTKLSAVEATWKQSTMTLSYKVTYSGLTGPATAAHFHGPAPAGVNAGVALPVTIGTPNLMTMQGEAVLTQQQAADLAAGLWYFNIHTAANPGGEIRGQMRLRG